MTETTIKAALGGNSYPGRGIIIGEAADGVRFIVYFIMGRSENSRNRLFERTEDGIRTRAFDEAKCTDPSLIIYAPVRRVGAALVVTNGDQTDTIRDELLKNGENGCSFCFHSALARREYEPDAPNFTPRISGLVLDGGYELSILKSEDQTGGACQRSFFKYEYERGVCHFIHTYEHDGAPIPSFCGEPHRIASPDGSAEEIARYVWSCLDESNRVSLFAQRLFADGTDDSFIINRHGK